MADELIDSRYSETPGRQLDIDVERSESIAISLYLGEAETVDSIVVVEAQAGAVAGIMGQLFVFPIANAPRRRIVGVAWLPGATSYSLRVYPSDDQYFRGVNRKFRPRRRARRSPRRRWRVFSALRGRSHVLLRRRCEQ